MTLTSPEKTQTKYSDPIQVVKIPAGPPRTFALTKELIDGEYIGPRTVSSHRLADVHIGDGLLIEYSKTKDGVSTCHAITIRNRQSGKVPPRANGKYAPEAKQPPAD